MKKITVRVEHLFWAFLALVFCLLPMPTAHATLFGQGDFGDSTFGSLSSITLALGSDVNFTLSSGGGGYEGSGSSTVTVTTNDAVGYRLYLYAPTTTLTRVGGSQTIANSANSSPASLAANTWGYNLSGSTTNYQGLSSAPEEIKVTSEPYTSGDTTNVYFGAKVDLTQAAGTYTGTVRFTVVPRFED